MNISPTDVLDQYQLDTEAKRTINKELGQDEFLELMMAQLEHQDPMKPMDNGEFLGQMAQFSTVTGIEGMQESLEKLSDTYASGQTLQSSQLVGKQILIESRSMELDTEHPTGGSFDIESASGDVKLDISNSAGTVVRQMSLGDYTAGRHPFEWDGHDNDGNRMPAGNYTANINALRGEEYESATVMTRRVVDSVEFGNGGETRLNTKQGDVLTLSEIRQIRSVAPATETVK